MIPTPRFAEPNALTGFIGNQRMSFRGTNIHS
jgi:hypothetical protein